MVSFELELTVLVSRVLFALELRVLLVSWMLFALELFEAEFEAESSDITLGPVTLRHNSHKLPDTFV